MYDSDDDFDSMAPRSEKFVRLRAECLKAGKLYEDPEFPAVNKSIYFSKQDAAIVWKRPREICKDPQFFVDGASRHDLCQGKLGNCWFLAATAILSTKPKLFRHNVPKNQDFGKDYAGIFHFNFWQYGEWVEVIVDDRLPTKNGKLMFCHNRAEPNEFWSALFEKAYAKLNESYQALEIGYSTDALVDFTGGIGEFIDLKDVKSTEKLFKMMNRIFSKSSFLCSSVEVQGDKFEEKLQNGLVTGHAYSITDIREVTIGSTTLKMVRLRNPWGHKEWNGAWSDGSPEWKQLSESQKNDLELKVQDDGEFWMSFADWLTNYHTLQICHLTPDTLEVGPGKHEWCVSNYNGSWVRGLTAGGSGAPPHEDSVWNNPQYLVELKDPDDNKKKTALIVSLMQKHTRVKKTKEKMADTELPIGFDIYKYSGHDHVDVTSADHVDHSCLHLDKKMCQYEYFRERTSHFSLHPGIYCIIPATYEADQEGDFLLRIATEKPIKAGEVEEEIHIDKEPVLEDGKEAKFASLYDECSGEDKVLDARELKSLLNKGLKRDVDDEFSIATTRALIQTATGDRESLLSKGECRKIWRKVKLFQETFVKYDADVSGKLDSTELEKAMAAIGVKVSKKDLVSVVKKFCSKTDQLTMDEFTLVAAKTSFANGLFRKVRQGAAAAPDAKATVTLTKTELLDLLL